MPLASDLVQSGFTIVGHNTEMTFGTQSALKKICNTAFVFNNQYSHATPFNRCPNNTRMRA